MVRSIFVLSKNILPISNFKGSVSPVYCYSMGGALSVYFSGRSSMSSTLCTPPPLAARNGEWKPGDLNQERDGPARVTTQNVDTLS